MSNSDAEEAFPFYQFGKTDKDSFVLDFMWPVTPIQVCLRACVNVNVEVKVKANVILKVNVQANLDVHVDVDVDVDVDCA